jgi:hypothetical protein
MPTRNSTVTTSNQPSKQTNTSSNKSNPSSLPKKKGKQRALTPEPGSDSIPRREEEEEEGSEEEVVDRDTDMEEEEEEEEGEERDDDELPASILPLGPIPRKRKALKDNGPAAKIQRGAHFLNYSC